MRHLVEQRRYLRTQYLQLRGQGLHSAGSGLMNRQLKLSMKDKTH